MVNRVMANLFSTLKWSGGLRQTFRVVNSRLWRKMNAYFRFLDGGSQGISINSPAIKNIESSQKWYWYPKNDSRDEFSITRETVKYKDVLFNVESGHMFRNIAGKYYYVAESDYRFPLQAIWSTPRPHAKVVFETINETVINLPSRSGNYYHFLIEDLPDLIREKMFYRDALVVSPFKLPQFAQDSLTLLGHRFILTKFKFISAKCLIKRAKTPFGFFPSLEDVELIREAFREKVELHTGDAKLFILRNSQDELERRIANSFHSNGFRVIETHKLSIAQQISIFGGARIIAGLHGAGLANMVFAAHGGEIIEIGSKNEGSHEWWRVANGWCYEPLANACGHDYTFVEY